MSYGLLENRHSQYAILEKKINTLPDEYIFRLSDYVDFLIYEVEKKKEKTSSFNAECEKAQSWAKDVGLTESDITDTLKEIRAEKRS